MRYLQTTGQSKHGIVLWKVKNELSLILIGHKPVARRYGNHTLNNLGTDLINGTLRELSDRKNTFKNHSSRIRNRIHDYSYPTRIPTFLTSIKIPKLNQERFIEYSFLKLHKREFCSFYAPLVLTFHLYNYSR